MTTMIEAFGLSHLSGEQKRELGIALLDEADKAEHRSDLPADFLEELRLRSADIDANPDDNIPWVQVRDESRARLKK